MPRDVVIQPTPSDKAKSRRSLNSELQFEPHERNVRFFVQANAGASLGYKVV